MDKHPGRSVLISDHGRERAEGREQRGGESREEERAERRREFRRRREQRGGGSREEEGVPEERTRAGDQRLVVRGEADRADVRVLYHRNSVSERKAEKLRNQHCGNAAKGRERTRLFRTTFCRPGVRECADRAVGNSKRQQPWG